MGPGPLVGTKLHAPRPRSGLVPRPRLTSPPRHGPDRPRLTLVSAPAGFGKTTLLADRFGDGPSTAWLSLDPGDDDPTVFLEYLLAAIDTVAPGVAAHARALLPSPVAIE